MPERWTETEMIELAASAVRKIDGLGTRGATLVTLDEIEAMAAALVCLGLRPYAQTQPQAAEPEFTTQRTANV